MDYEQIFDTFFKSHEWATVATSYGWTPFFIKLNNETNRYYLFVAGKSKEKKEIEDEKVSSIKKSIEHCFHIDNPKDDYGLYDVKGTALDISGIWTPFVVFQGKNEGLKATLSMDKGKTYDVEGQIDEIFQSFEIPGFNEVVLFHPVEIESIEEDSDIMDIILLPSNDPEQAVQHSLAAQQTLNSALSLPNELQAEIGKNLHGNSLVKAVSAGLQVDNATRLRAQHSYIWSCFFDDESISRIEERVRYHGNIFIVGYGLRRLYEEAFKEPKCVSGSTDLILSWTPQDLMLLDWIPEYIKAESSNLNIILKLAKSSVTDHLFIEDFGKYLKNDNGRLWTSLIYLKDESWDIHDVEVNFFHIYEEASTHRCSLYKYSLRMENHRQSKCSGRDQQIYLREMYDGQSWEENNVQNPKKPWHLASSAHGVDDKSWWEDLITSTKSNGRWQSNFPYKGGSWTLSM